MLFLFVLSISLKLIELDVDELSLARNRFCKIYMLNLAKHSNFIDTSLFIHTKASTLIFQVVLL